MLSTTACAILGLLAVQPSTAYDLVGRMARNYRFFWPRAESLLYAEVKKLEADGLARAEEGATGKRKHTIYHVTPAGERALEVWLREPASPLVLEHELLLKIAYADFGEPALLLQHLKAFEDRITAARAVGSSIAHDYTSGKATLGDRVHLTALVWRFFDMQHEACAKWARWAQREVSTWKTTKGDAKAKKRALAIFARD